MLFVKSTGQDTTPQFSKRSLFQTKTNAVLYYLAAIRHSTLISKVQTFAATAHPAQSFFSPAMEVKKCSV